MSSTNKTNYAKEQFNIKKSFTARLLDAKKRPFSKEKAILKRKISSCNLVDAHLKYHLKQHMLRVSRLESRLMKDCRKRIVELDQAFINSRHNEVDLTLPEELCTRLESSMNQIESLLKVHRDPHNFGYKTRKDEQQLCLIRSALRKLSTQSTGRRNAPKNNFFNLSSVKKSSIMKYTETFDDDDDYEKCWSMNFDFLLDTKPVSSSCASTTTENDCDHLHASPYHSSREQSAWNREDSTGGKVDSRINSSKCDFPIPLLSIIPNHNKKEVTTKIVRENAISPIQNPAKSLTRCASSWTNTFDNVFSSRQNIDSSQLRDDEGNSEQGNFIISYASMTNKEQSDDKNKENFYVVKRQAISPTVSQSPCLIRIISSEKLGTDGG